MIFLEREVNRVMEIHASQNNWKRQDVSKTYFKRRYRMNSINT
jgi:hypothetical protein